MKSYEGSFLSGGTAAIGGLPEASDPVAGRLTWQDSAPVREDTALDARRGTRARMNLEELIRQEEIRLVQRVFLVPGLTRRVVLFAGVERDNGCARICIGVGSTLARLTTQSVCVVDVNPHSTELHRLVDTNRCEGLAAAMEHPEAAPSFAFRLEPGNLWVLPGGSPSNPDPPRTVERVQRCLEALSGHFNFLVINTPPVNGYADSLTLGQFVDGVLLVLEANVTRRDTARHVKNRLEDLNVPLLGVVLNNRTFPIPEPLYRLL